MATGSLQLLLLPLKRLQSLCWCRCKRSAPLPPQAPMLQVMWLHLKCLCVSRPRIAPQLLLLKASVVIMVLVKHCLVFWPVVSWLLTHLHRCSRCRLSGYHVTSYYCWATSAFAWESCLTGVLLSGEVQIKRGSIATRLLEQLILLALIYEIHKRPKRWDGGKGGSWVGSMAYYRTGWVTFALEELERIHRPQTEP